MSAVALHHVVDGPVDAPPLLLLNSLGSDLSMWEPQLPALSRRFRVIRCDTRGHGLSPVPPGDYALDDLGRDALALLDRLGVASAHLVGLSLGGMVGMWLAAHAPERVRRLVLCCTSARLGPPQGWAERARTVRAHGTGAVADAVTGRWLTPAFAETHPDLVRRLKDMIIKTPAEGYAGACAAIEHMDQRADLARIAAPTLVIAGRDDPATPPAHARLIADGIPGARLEVLPEAAHLASVERADAVTALLLDHLEDRAAEDAGMIVRRQVLGDAHVDRAVAGTTPLTAPFQDLITRYAWGGVWARDTLDRRTRSCVTLAVLTALHCHDELAMHVRAARRNGLTQAEIGEVLLHTAIYAGVPASNAALAVARRVLAEEE
ncbi:bifunctional 3-oxoadipate enol-lactonase/4-carboxymuconolactone decarboxylase PcaDC [Catenuloplanes atrovinosus]|uniref:3-oxoadipate enol-lactonase/4-carboxymuconolactone decarboxylase n=1 Tax=Catenuloplanes atrovinosus TaxID=137266 RepID=A0AAE4C7C3_9ACTN|nr:3-oxoadipate enol-lactonase [Catenuloplanes atrovinosus]MDR7273718.1 3-oxoadipate enol-lactonase/4-carboxymuconolactone decarboxylase [Catenuloplanes atrovinosus]